MRIIAQRCLYGVDKNPLAAEMAKLSLWLLTLAKDKPFEFLDHSIRCGDSLVGLHNIDQLRHYSLKPDADDAVLFGGPFEEAVEQAIHLRLKLEDMPANTVDDVARQEKLLIEANEKIARLRCAADLLVAAEFWGESAKDKLERVRHAAVKSGYYVEKGPTEEFEQVAAKERRGQTMFHWPLEFPEVIVKRGGFDAFVGNPPFLGGLKLETAFGRHFREHIVEVIGNGVRGVRGTADLCTYFVLRVAQFSTSTSGLICTNTISQGDSRSVGLDTLVDCNWIIHRATSSRTWPGSAALDISELWSYHGNWKGPCNLDGRDVLGISAEFSEVDGSVSSTYRLEANSNKCFQGSNVMGIGFVLTPDEASSLIACSSHNAKVVFPYLSGQDVNSRPDQSPSRWIINFGDRSLEEAAQFSECMDIVRQRVKPERDSMVGRNPTSTRRGKEWWRYAQQAKALYKAIAPLERVLVTSRVSAYILFAFAPTNIVFSDRLVVFAVDSDAEFANLSSTFHSLWATRPGTTTHATIRTYFPSGVFDTYPFPSSTERVSISGHCFEEYRRNLLLARKIGLTDGYNLLHDPDETSADLQKLRDLHVEMDQAVAAAYGWGDLELGHGFHETKQGVRFTISEPARREVLQRLLKLNHERYAEEVKQGLHAKKGAAKKTAPKKKAASKRAKGESSLFDMEGDE